MRRAGTHRGRCRVRAAAIAGIVWLPLPVAGQVPSPSDPPSRSEIRVAPPDFLPVTESPGRGRNWPQEKLVVLSQAGARALLVDPVGRSVLAEVPTGIGPFRVAVSHDGRLAYVVNRGGPVGESSVTVIDLERGVARATFHGPPENRLHGVAVSRSGRRLWLTTEADGGVLELDARTGEVLMLWKTGGILSRALVASPEGHRLFVANAGSDSVTVIDRTTVVAHRIPVGHEPGSLDLSPDGGRLWVANRGDHTLTVIDARRQRRVADFPSGGLEPVSLRFRPDGLEVWVAHRRSRELVVFDARSRAEITRVSLPAAPGSIAFSRDGGSVYVTAPGAGRLFVLDARRKHVLASVPVGGNPDALAWSRLRPSRPLPN